MNKKTKSTIKKAGAIITGVAVIGLSAFAGAQLFPKTITKTTTVTHNITVPVEVPVPYEVVKNVTVKVDNGKLSTVLKYLYDNDGKINYITKDLTDSEVGLIVDRIVFVNDAKSIAAKAVKSRLFSKINNEEITLNDGSSYKVDSDKLTRLRVDSDFDEVMVDSINFDDQDATLEVTFRFDDINDLSFYGSAQVEFKSGDFYEIKDVVLNQE